MPPTNILTRHSPATLYYLLLKMCNPAVILAFNECLFLYEIKESPYLQFPIRPGFTCWDFCKHLPTCTAISFQYDRSGLCSFYNLQELNRNYRHEPSGKIYTGARACLLSFETQMMLENEAKKEQRVEYSSSRMIQEHFEGVRPEQFSQE